VKRKKKVVNFPRGDFVCLKRIGLADESIPENLLLDQKAFFQAEIAVQGLHVLDECTE